MQDQSPPKAAKGATPKAGKDTIKKTVAKKQLGLLLPLQAQLQYVKTTAGVLKDGFKVPAYIEEIGARPCVRDDSPQCRDFSPLTPSFT